jgi:hypothetical protein
MPRLAVEESALHVAWKVASADAASAGVLRDRLNAGQCGRLFELRSLDFADGEASAVLVPGAPLEDIVAAIWSAGGVPVALSLVRARLRRRA